jgi:uncharacterized protein YraI
MSIEDARDVVPATESRTQAEAGVQTEAGVQAEVQAEAQAAVQTGTAIAAHTYYTTSSQVTHVHSGPSTAYPLVDTLPAHSAVTIHCQTPGQSVSGPFGTSNIWDRIGSGRYVPDSYVYTGSDGYVAARC